MPETASSRSSACTRSSGATPLAEPEGWGERVSLSNAAGHQQVGIPGCPEKRPGGRSRASSSYESRRLELIPLPGLPANSPVRLPHAPSAPRTGARPCAASPRAAPAPRSLQSQRIQDVPATQGRSRSREARSTPRSRRSLCSGALPLGWRRAGRPLEKARR